MSAAVAALAVGAAGLLSQVPVLGGLFSGLAAVVEAVAFQMDGVLRPALGPLTQGFFKLSQMIFEADGIIGDIIGAIGTIVSIVAIAAAAAFQFGSGLATLSAAAGTAASVLGTIVGVITTVGAAILSLPGLIVAAIAEAQPLGVLRLGLALSSVVCAHSGNSDSVSPNAIFRDTVSDLSRISSVCSAV